MKKASIVERLESINMSEPERRRALHSLRTGYVISDGIMKVVNVVRSLRANPRSRLALKH